MLIGYARVCKFEQNLDLQTDALKNIGIEKFLLIRLVVLNQKNRNLTIY